MGGVTLGLPGFVTASQLGVAEARSPLGALAWALLWARRVVLAGVAGDGGVSRMAQEGKDDDRNRDLAGFADPQGEWDDIGREQHW